MRFFNIDADADCPRKPVHCHIHGDAFCDRDVDVGTADGDTCVSIADDNCRTCSLRDRND